MSFETDLYSFLNNNIIQADDVAGDVTNTDSDKFLVFQKITPERYYSHDGFDRIEKAHYQFDAYSKKRIDAIVIVDELRDKLEDYVGLMGSTRVQGAFIIDESSNHEKETNLYRRRVDFEIQYYE